MEIGKPIQTIENRPLRDDEGQNENAGNCIGEQEIWGILKR